jgi:hypothetical protein
LVKTSLPIQFTKESDNHQLQKVEFDPIMGSQI